MRRTKYLISSHSARATSTCSPLLHSRPHPIPRVVLAAACLPVSDLCCHGNGKVKGLHPVAFLLSSSCFPLPVLGFVCIFFLCCTAEYTCLVTAQLHACPRAADGALLRLIPTWLCEWPLTLQCCCGVVVV